MARKKKRVKIEDNRIETTTIEETHIDFVVIPPDGGWGWVIVLATFMSNMVIDGTMYTFGIFLNDIKLEFQSTEAKVSWANSLLTGFYFMCGPFVCAIANRRGFRFVGLLGAVIGSLSLGMSSLAPSLELYILAYGVFGGIGFAMTYISNLLVVGFYFERWRALATAISVSGSSIGTIIIPPIFNIYLASYSWRVKYRILSVSAFISGLMSVTYKPIPPSKIYSEDRKDDDKISLVSTSFIEDNPKSIFYKKHNTAYPTNADYVQRGSYSILTDRDNQAPGPSSSISSVKTFKTWLTKQSSISFVSGRPIAFENINQTPTKCKACKCACCYHVSVQRPMYKDDILFTGSVATLPQYDKTRSEKAQASLDYHMSVTRVATLKDLEEGAKCCICCPQAVVRTLATMLDCTLLKSSSFCLLALSGMFTFLGFYTPYLYIIDYAVSKEMPVEKATYLISAIGVSNGIGRLSTGLVSLMPPNSALVITDVCLIFTGLSSVLVIYAWEEKTFFSFALVYGLTTACLASLRPIIVVNLYGLEKLTNAIGIIVLFEGAAALTGVPLSTKLKEFTNSYEVPFLFAGGTILFSVLLLVPIRPLKNRENKKREERERRERARKQEETRHKLAQINKLK